MHCNPAPRPPDIPEARDGALSLAGVSGPRDAPPGDEDGVAAVVAALRPALRLRGLPRSVAVARVLIDRLYGGDVTGFRSREGKAVSLRRLADEGAPMSAAALYRCLSVHEIWLRTRGRRWPSLGASHYRAVESLLPQAQEAWLSRAAAHGWSAAHLRQVIRARGAPTTGRGGRLPQHPYARFVTRIARELALLDRVVEELHIAPDEHTRMRQLADRLDTVASRCRSHAARLRTSIGFEPPGDGDASAE